MPIYVNVGYPQAPDGKEWKHVQDCAVLHEREAAGYPIQKLRNTDTGKRTYAEHKRRRCPVCMPDGRWPDSEPHNQSVGAEAT